MILAVLAFTVVVVSFKLDNDWTQEQPRTARDQFRALADMQEAFAE